MRRWRCRREPCCSRGPRTQRSTSRTRRHFSPHPTDRMNRLLWDVTTFPPRIRNTSRKGRKGQSRFPAFRRRPPRRHRLYLVSIRVLLCEIEVKRRVPRSVWPAMKPSCWVTIQTLTEKTRDCFRDCLRALAAAVSAIPGSAPAVRPFNPIRFLFRRPHTSLDRPTHQPALSRGVQE